MVHINEPRKGDTKQYTLHRTETNVKNINDYNVLLYVYFKNILLKQSQEERKKEQITGHVTET